MFRPNRILAAKRRAVDVLQLITQELLAIMINFLKRLPGWDPNFLCE
jgi:hypothetical protein